MISANVIRAFVIFFSLVAMALSIDAVYFEIGEFQPFDEDFIHYQAFAVSLCFFVSLIIVALTLSKLFANYTVIMVVDVLLFVLVLAGFCASATGEVGDVVLHEECDALQNDEVDDACDVYRASLAFTFFTWVSLIPMIFFDFKARSEIV